MKNITKIYLLWFLTLAFGVTLGYQILNKENKRTIQQPSILKGQKLLMTDSLGNMNLLELSEIKPLKLYHAYVKIGDETLLIRRDTIGGTIWEVPEKPLVWKNYFTALLGVSDVNNVNSAWNSTYNQWQSMVKVEFDSLKKLKGWDVIPEETKLGVALLLKLKKGNTLYIQNRKLIEGVGFIPLNLQDNSQLFFHNKEKKEQDKNHGLDWLLIGGMLICIMLGAFFTSLLSNPVTDIPNFQVEEPTPNPEQETPIDGVLLSNPALAEDDFMSRYIEGFSQIYGTYYNDIQAIPIEPTELEKAKIKQKLVEMGLHAFSLMRAYRMNNLQHPEKEPNLLLILEQKTVSALPAQLYRVYVKDAEKMEKRFSILQKIIKEMGIETLDRALLIDVYLSSEYLSKKS